MAALLFPDCGRRGKNARTAVSAAVLEKTRAYRQACSAVNKVRRGSWTAEPGSEGRRRPGNPSSEMTGRRRRTLSPVLSL